MQASLEFWIALFPWVWLFVPMIGPAAFSLLHAGLIGHAGTFTLENRIE